MEKTYKTGSWLDAYFFVTHINLRVNLYAQVFTCTDCIISDTLPRDHRFIHAGNVWAKKPNRTVAMGPMPKRCSISVVCVGGLNREPDAQDVIPPGLIPAQNRLWLRPREWSCRPTPSGRCRSKQFQRKNLINIFRHMVAPPAWHPPCSTLSNCRRDVWGMSGIRTANA